MQKYSLKMTWQSVPRSVNLNDRPQMCQLPENGTPIHFEKLNQRTSAAAVRRLSASFGCC